MKFEDFDDDALRRLIGGDDAARDLVALLNDLAEFLEADRDKLGELGQQVKAGRTCDQEVLLVLFAATLNAQTAANSLIRLVVVALEKKH